MRSADRGSATRNPVAGERGGGGNRGAKGSGNQTAPKSSDVGIEGGGPIVKNKLFFFGAVDPGWQSRTFLAPPNFPLASLGAVPRDRRPVSYAVKGTGPL